MQVGVFAKIFSGDNPITVFEAARLAGFATVQFNMACSGLPSMPDHIPDGTAALIHDASERTGVAVAAVSATYNMIHPDPGVRRRGHNSLALIAAVAKAVGARLLTLCTGTRDRDNQWRGHPDNAGPEAWRDLVASMEIAVDIAERFGLDLGVEPELANVVNSAERAQRLIADVGSPRLQIVLDPANLFEIESLGRQHAIVADGVALLADRLAMAHAKDRNAASEFVAAGTGVLDYPFYLRALKSAGFDGPLIAHGLTSDEAPGVARFLRRQLTVAGMR